VGFIIGLAFSGLVIGALGRLAIPGRQPIGCLGTMLAGLAGSFIAGIVGRVVFGHSYAPGIIASVLGAAPVVWIVSRTGERRNRAPYS
jgi:uncharacterized membrane protein YeaQ/YmgE (transglycosylase-associated protein family)